MLVEAVGILPSNVGDDDIVTSCVKAQAELKARHIELRLYEKTKDKPLPFKKPENMQVKVPPTPRDVLAYLEQAIASDKISIITLDTMTQMASDYVNEYVTNSDDGFAAWGELKKYLTDIVTAVKRSPKPIIMMAHEQATLNEATGIVDQSAPFQGGFAKIGLEASFTTIVGCRVIQPSKLEDRHLNDLLVVTEQEEIEDMKYVFQTRLTRDTRGCKYRSPMGVFAPNELYIDNDAVLVMQRLNEFHNQ